MGETATNQLADTMETGEAGSNTDKDGKTKSKEQAGQQKIILLHGEDGVALTTPQSQTIAAGTNMDLVAQRDTNQTSGRRWIHNAGQHISLFVAGVKDQIALKLIAAKGKVQLQAQSDDIELTADKNARLTAIKGKSLFNAKQEILLTAGGAYIRIKGGKIELHAPGKVSIKGGSHDWGGGTSLGKTFNEMPTTKFDDKFQLKDESTGESLANRKYIIERSFGEKEYGTTDINGYTHNIKNPDIAEQVRIFLKD